MTDKEAMKQALEALNEVTGWQWAGPMRVMDEVEDAITALRQALEQPADEPVAWFRYENGMRVYYETKAWDDLQPRYTRPQPAAWVGLTDEEAEKCRRGAWQATYQAIDALLREKNGGAA